MSNKLEEIKIRLNNNYYQDYSAAEDIPWLVDRVEYYRNQSSIGMTQCEVSYGRIIKKQDIQIERMQAVVDAARSLVKRYKDDHSDGNVKVEGAMFEHLLKVIKELDSE